MHRQAPVPFVFFFFFIDTPTTEIYTLSLHDALPISAAIVTVLVVGIGASIYAGLRGDPRSEEHTSELQSRVDLVCRLLLEKKTKSSCSTRRCETPTRSCRESSRACGPRAATASPRR